MSPLSTDKEQADSPRKVSKQLRVLMVEDSADDTELLMREFRRGGYDPAYEQVCTPEDMEAALDKQSWDVIIADFNMPSFSAPDALSLMQRKGLDLPFIIVSGSIGEDTAVETIKSGVTDYLMKDKLARFVPAVERGLQEAEERQWRRRAEGELKALNEALEKRVTERTSELASLNEELQVKIAERREAEKIIRQMAYYDALTSLPNRILFNDRLGVELAHARRNKQKLAILFLDLDGFKKVNDTMGHTMGDKLLKGIGERLRECVREDDTVARMGGDEFTLLLPGIKHPEGATKVARKVIDSVKQPIALDGRDLNVTTSIGIALYPEDGEDTETLLKNADIAMYRAKDAGRDNFQFYST